MDWADVGIGLVSGVVGGALVSIVNNRLAIRREELAEARETRRRIHEASAAVADLLSAWIKPRYTREDGKATNEDRWMMQRECWKTLMWLDENLVRLVVKRLANRPDALPAGQVIVEARKILLDLDDTALTDVNYWPPLERETATRAG